MTELEQKILSQTIGTCDWDFLGIVENIIDRIEDIYTEDEDELYEQMNYAIDDELIYYKDQWEVLEHYCTPQDANWYNAMEYLFEDIYSVLQNLRKEKAKWKI